MKEDLRVQRTKQMIRRAFIDLLSKKSFEEITVREITEAAFCNRNTFYLHYEDKYDLMEKLCDEAIGELAHKLESEDSGKYGSIEEYYLEIPKICMGLMEKDIDFYINVFARNRYPQFETKYKQAILDYVFRSFKVDEAEYKRKRMEVEFSTSGLIGVHRYWILNRDKYSKEDILEIFKNLSVGMGKIIFEK